MSWRRARSKAARHSPFRAAPPRRPRPRRRSGLRASVQARQGIGRRLRDFIPQPCGDSALPQCSQAVSTATISALDGVFPCMAKAASRAGSRVICAVPLTRNNSVRPGTRKISATDGFSRMLIRVSIFRLPGRSGITSVLEIEWRHEAGQVSPWRHIGPAVPVRGCDRQER